MAHQAAERGSATITLTTAVALLLLLAVLIGAVAATTGPQSPAGCTAQPAPGQAAAAIPRDYLTDYQKTGAQYGIPWTVLAAIGTIESDNGQSNAPGVHTATNPFGAAGPMQFGVIPGSPAGDAWGGPAIHPAAQHYAGYGGDGNGDGIVNVYDPADAIPAAARYLTANGAPANLQQAIFAYNHASWYVTDVLNLAARYAANGAQAITAPASTTCQQAALGPLPAGAAGKILSFAATQLGKPYIFGGTGPDAWDCSGLAMMAYRAAGIAIPRTAAQQWDFGRRIPASQAHPGDLVFFAGANGTPAAPGHVGIIVSPARHLMIDAYATGHPVSYDTYGIPSSRGGLSPVVGFTRPYLGPR